MRDIKFRVWNVNTLKMSRAFDLVDYGEDQDGEAGRGELSLHNGLDVVHNVLMQFTELKDKNGREIYEGDIVQYFHSVFSDRQLYVISFANGCFYLGSTEDAEYNDYIVNVSPLKVIGNIYENQELLK